MSSDADIIIYGGAAGGGKTFAILMEPLRHIRNKNFGAVILRKNAVQITVEGGLWDESFEVYGGIKGAVPRKSPSCNGCSRAALVSVSSTKSATRNCSSGRAHRLRCWNLTS